MIGPVIPVAAFLFSGLVSVLPRAADSVGWLNRMTYPG